MYSIAYFSRFVNTPEKAAAGRRKGSGPFAGERPLSRLQRQLSLRESLSRPNVIAAGGIFAEGHEQSVT